MDGLCIREAPLQEVETMATTRPTPSRDQTPTDKLHSILRICQKMNTEHNLTTLLQLIAQETSRLIGADRATVLVLDRNKQEL